MMRKIYFLLTSAILLTACQPRTEADLIIHNATIYTVDSNFTVCQAMAIKDGRIIATGTSEHILRNYYAEQITDAGGKFIYPGFIDAHCHFLGYGQDLNKIWLTGIGTFEAVLDTMVRYRDKTFSGWIFGRGWDQNLWPSKQFPDREKLDQLFPDIPVIMLRIDGHAALLNAKALEMAGITDTTVAEGGHIILKNGRLTGLLLDKAIDLIYEHIAPLNMQGRATALLNAQRDCFALGLTTVSDAGLENGGLSLENILLIDSLQRTRQLKMKIYAMAAIADTAYYFANGPLRNDMLSVQSFKVYADGALGSRGACMLLPYSDDTSNYGLMQINAETLERIAHSVAKNKMQLNTHCIGDSANRTVLNIYGRVNGIEDLRWRIEHAQVVHVDDIPLFGKYKIIPSVQPVHATSDMYWAEERLGAERMKGAYAYKALMKQNGMIANGSDFPVEYLNPLFGFYAAVVRKDQKGYPKRGFEMQNALTREEALRGMTIWAAYADFDDYEKGSLEKGKWADFVMLDRDLMTVKDSELFKAVVLDTYVNGLPVYQKASK